MKAFTGGDRRTARALHKDPFEYTPTAVPVLQFNRTPRIIEEDEGLRRRLVFIPFDQELHKLEAGRRRSPREVAQLYDQDLSGILNWLLEGYRIYAEAMARGQGAPLGIVLPKRLEAEKTRLLHSADPVQTFLSAATERAADRRIAFAEFAAAYRAWAEANGAMELSSKALSRLLTEKSVTVGIKGGQSYLIGRRWTEAGELGGEATQI